jgi:PmbA protein
MALDDALTLLTDLIAKAKAAGADEADALLLDQSSLSVAFRLGRPEKVERSEAGDIGLRVLIGKRQALVSSSDRGLPALNDLVERAVAMARTVPEDPFCGLASAEQLVRSLPDLDICDPQEPTPEQLVDWAKRAEDAARAVPGVTNSEGAEAGWGRTRIALAASNGLAHSYSLSSFQIAAAVLAGDTAGGMERDYDFSSAIHAGDLRTPEDIGTEAGRRTVRRLGARKARTAKLPIVLDPRVSRSLLGHLSAAINGGAIARGTSFLKDSLGKRVFAKGVRVIDDPHRRRGLRSKPFDGEGVANGRRTFIEDGVLTSWVLDLRSARQLGMETTGHAARSVGGPPSPSVTNFWMEPGAVTPAEMILDITEGFYVTELFGMGVNGVTGDYSRGAAGFWIVGGELAYPVSEVTVAGNLKEMFRQVTPANDLVWLHGTDAPTLRIDGMTIAGA